MLDEMTSSEKLHKLPYYLCNMWGFHIPKIWQFLKLFTIGNFHIFVSEECTK